MSKHQFPILKVDQAIDNKGPRIKIQGNKAGLEALAMLAEAALDPNNELNDGKGHVAYGCAIHETDWNSPTSKEFELSMVNIDLED